MPILQVINHIASHYKMFPSLLHAVRVDDTAYGTSWPDTQIRIQLNQGWQKPGLKKKSPAHWFFGGLISGRLRVELHSTSDSAVVRVQL